MERLAKTALVIIDMQEGSFTPRSKRHDTEAGGAVIVLQPTTIRAGARVSG